MIERALAFLKTLPPNVSVLPQQSSINLDHTIFYRKQAWIVVKVNDNTSLFLVLYLKPFRSMYFMIIHFLNQVILSHFWTKLDHQITLGVALLCTDFLFLTLKSTLHRYMYNSLLSFTAHWNYCVWHVQSAPQIQCKSAKTKCFVGHNKAAY